MLPSETRSRAVRPANCFRFSHTSMKWNAWSFPLTPLLISSASVRWKRIRKDALREFVARKTFMHSPEHSMRIFAEDTECLWPWLDNCFQNSGWHVMRVFIWEKVFPPHVFNADNGLSFSFLPIRFFRTYFFFFRSPPRFSHREKNLASISEEIPSRFCSLSLSLFFITLSRNRESTGSDVCLMYGWQMWASLPCPVPVLQTGPLYRSSQWACQSTQRKSVPIRGKDQQFSEPFRSSLRWRAVVFEAARSMAAQCVRHHRQFLREEACRLRWCNPKSTTRTHEWYTP